MLLPLEQMFFVAVVPVAVSLSSVVVAGFVVAGFVIVAVPFAASLYLLY